MNSSVNTWDPIDARVEFGWVTSPEPPLLARCIIIMCLDCRRRLGDYGNITTPGYFIRTHPRFHRNEVNRATPPIRRIDMVIRNNPISNFRNTYLKYHECSIKARECTGRKTRRSDVLRTTSYLHITSHGHLIVLKCWVPRTSLKATPEFLSGIKFVT